MITKEQALTCIYFIQTIGYCNPIPDGFMQIRYTNEESLDKPIKWRANGKCKTWKTRPDEFKLPIKHGLYDYGYITNENAHMFEVAE